MNVHIDLGVLSLECTCLLWNTVSAVEARTQPPLIT